MLKRASKKTTQQQLPQQQIRLLEMWAPVSLNFQPNHFTVGDQYMRSLVFLGYPTKLNLAWLQRIKNYPGVAVSMHATPMDPEKLILQINRSVSELTANLESAGKASVQSMARKTLEDAEELLNKINLEQQQVFHVLVSVLLYAGDLEELNTKTKRIQAMLAGQGIKGRNLIYLQEQSYQTVCPWNYTNPEVFNLGKWNMPSETVAASFPFTRAGINDGQGIVLGNDDEGGLALVDFWQRGGDRTNSNLLVLAKPGAGKSYAVKMMMLRELLQGTRFIVIDPEREYKDFCTSLNGSWINCGSGEGVINPLQLRNIGQEEEEKLQSVLSLHMQTVRTFFHMYIRDLTDIEKSVLEDLILEVYARHGLTLASQKLPEHLTYPDIREVYEEIEKRCESNLSMYERLKVLLKKAAIGADRHLWQGQTTIGALSRLTVLDVHDLQHANDEVRRTQYYNVLTWAWSELTKDRTSRTILVVDEAWLLVDPQTPQALQFLRETSKRIRKYEGGLWVISQNVMDFLAPEVLRHGQALLDNPCYKLFLGQGEKDLEALTGLFKFSEAEVELLQTARRGEGLFIAGNQRIRLQIKSAPYEAELLTGGGR